MVVVANLTFGNGQILLDDSKSSGAWQGASLTDVFIDNLESDLDKRKFAINRGKQLSDSGLYIVSYLADGKPKRNYKMGRGKDIGNRLASYKTYHAEEHSLRIHACLCMPAKTPLDMPLAFQLKPEILLQNSFSLKKLWYFLRTFQGSGLRSTGKMCRFF